MSVDMNGNLIKYDIGGAIPLTTEEIAKAAYKMYCQGGNWENLYPPSQECWRRIVEFIRSEV